MADMAGVPHIDLMELALPAPEAAAIGWDQPTAVSGDPGGSYDYAALPAPEPEAKRLSTPEEINAFIEVA